MARTGKGLRKIRNLLHIVLNEVNFFVHERTAPHLDWTDVLEQQTASLAPERGRKGLVMRKQRSFSPELRRQVIEELPRLGRV